MMPMPLTMPPSSRFISADERIRYLRHDMMMPPLLRLFTFVCRQIVTSRITADVYAADADEDADDDDR
jgi:hypothetical protein